MPPPITSRVTVLAACAFAAIAAASVISAQRGDPRQSGPSASAPPPASRSLEGVWNFSTLTPLERPARFAGRPTMTPEEAAQYEADVQARDNADRRDGPASVDVDRAYNDVWFDRGTHVAVVDGQARTSLIVDPPDGHVPPLTPEAQRRVIARLQARRAHPADGPEDRSLAERCLSFNAGPPMLPAPYNNFVQIFQFPGYVVLLNEMIHDARIVRLDGTHAPSTIRKFLGDSIGRWDGDTLVVDTTNFTGQSVFRGSTDRLHLVERFTRTAPGTLLYEFTVDDPATFTRPWTAALPMTRSDEPIYEYACHEGNESMVGILRGARVEEKGAPKP
jgi:hypothetical protein